MKQLVILVVIFNLLFTSITCWVGLIEHDLNEAKKQGYEDAFCFTTHRDLKAFKKGEIKRLYGECAVAECRPDRNVKLTGCAPVAVAEPCYIAPGILSKPFPECCYEVICPEPNENKLQTLDSK